MRKIINGKLYNTNTAIFIAEWDNGLNFTDFNYKSEELYVTKKGNYFFQYEYWDCYELFAITDSEAAEWLEEHGFVEEYEEYFGAEEA